MNIKLFIFAILLQILLIHNKCQGKHLELTAVAFAYSEDGQLYTPIAERFNEYAKKKNIDIHLNVNLFTPVNTSIVDVDNFASLIEQNERRKSGKYDIIFYDTMYSRRFSPYFIDLKKYLPEEHLKPYYSGVANQTCIYEGKWVGIPLTVDYDVLYSNMDLLNKYQKRVPRTWDELMETAKYITEREKEEGNEVVGYNGLFPDYETAICSYQEFIYSFRNSYSSPYPAYTSNEALEALNKLKQMMNEISSVQLFKANEEATIINMITNKAIFHKFWNVPNLNEEVYKRSRLPGRFDGLSGTTIGGSNIGVNKYISDEKIDAAIEIIKYMTSKTTQKECVLNYGFVSAITDLYYDDDVCEKENCELYRGFQPIARPGMLTDDYGKYSFKFRQYMHEFLFENADAIETLTKINDLTKVYHVSFDITTSLEGFIVLLITMILATLMLFSLVFLFIDSTKKCFHIISVKSWLLVILGLMLYLGAIFTEYGELTNLKCRLNFIFISVGYTLVIVPYLNQLIANIPEKDNFASTIDRNRKLILSIYSVMDIALNISLIFISSFKTKDMEINDGKNYRICKFDDPIGKYIMLALMVGKIGMTIAFTFLLFIEWSIVKTVKDIRILTSTLYVNILTIAAVIIMKFVKIDYYKNHFIIYSAITLIFVFSNYLFIYGMKIIFILMKGSDAIGNNPIYGSQSMPIVKAYDTYNSEVTKSQSLASKNSSFSSRMLYYHYYKGNENDHEVNYVDNSLSNIFVRKEGGK